MLFFLKIFLKIFFLQKIFKLSFTFKKNEMYCNFVQKHFFRKLNIMLNTIYLNNDSFSMFWLIIKMHSLCSFTIQISIEIFTFEVNFDKRFSYPSK